MELLRNIGRSVDKLLTGIGLTIQYAIFIAAFFLFILYVFPLLESGLYLGALAFGVLMLIISPFLLIYLYFKKPSPPQ
jgi:hypothetical protein